MKINLKSGKEVVTFFIPDDRIMDTLTGPDIPGAGFESLKKSVYSGIVNCLPENIQTKKTAIIVPDNTRLWARGDIFVPVIVRALLDQGIPRENIAVIIALGTHADFSEDQFPALVGDFCAEHITILNSANQNDGRLVYLGGTLHGTPLYITKEACEADHIIIFGGVLHHLIAGFGGGRKYILPGIAGYDSIQQNHSLAIRDDGSAHPMVRQAQLDKNPVHEDMADAARIFLKGKTCSYTAIAANGEGNIFYAGTGEISSEFYKGCEQVNRACTVKIPQKGDFALISAGGQRTDRQLYQATKALFNAVEAVKENGQILFVAKAQDGIGNEVFGAALKNHKGRPEKLGRKLTEKFDMPSYVAFRVLDLLKRFRITLVSDFSRIETEELGFNYTGDVDNYVHKILKGKGYIIPFAENILPVQDDYESR